MAMGEPTAKRQPEIESGELVGQPEIDTLMRRFFAQSRGSEVSPPRTVVAEPEPDVTRPRRDFDMACELLERAAQAFDLLVVRCQRLEGDLVDVSERARAQAAEQDETLDQWKRLASGLKAQAEASEQALASLKARCDGAEARAAMSEARASAMEKASAQAAGYAALAEQLSTKLHDKVVTAFGIGSRAHPVLEAVATQAAE